LSFDPTLKESAVERNIEVYAAIVGDLKFDFSDRFLVLVSFACRGSFVREKGRSRSASKKSAKHRETKKLHSSPSGAASD
jgi:hypothetical protein